MNKFLRLVALLAFVSAATAVPQGLAPSIEETKAVEHMFSKYSLPEPSVAVFARSIDYGAVPSAPALPLAVPVSLPVSPRQLHNADYGSGNGPTGNPQPDPAQTTSTPIQSPSPAVDGAKPTTAAGDSAANAQKRRDLVLFPSNDINYSQE
ncbi:hypothetical protein EW145_g4028 [Phellinidium pouzarii]|uniref:Uncharacterized protein n=1 Tax=Phellinidium pouzarii TaxID=167371 RepID=A0A4S4L583_9AGAM|nr:hypothetical protein EW145_g4028 [Phellinidium pouzarii]